MNYPSFLNNTEGIKEELNKDIGYKIIQHRNKFREILVARYTEMLPYLITYREQETHEEIKKLSIDFVKLEYALRSNRHVAIGLNSYGEIIILGFVRNVDSNNQSDRLLSYRLRTEKDIDFIIPDNVKLPNYNEISNFDGARTGNFIVLSNKSITLTSDEKIINHYANELAEITLSRFSLIIQSKILTFFKSEVNDESVNQIVNNLYNGVPVTKVSDLFDPDEQIYTFDNASVVASNLTELKREYQNKLSELNNALGINSLAVEKNSGVSDTEAKSNRAFTTSNANIYLTTRNNQLKLLNKRFNLKIEAIYNDDVTSELSDLTIGSNNGGDDIENNNDTI